MARATQLEKRLVQFDRLGPESLLTQHKHNFKLAFAEIVESSVDPTKNLSLHGRHAGRWIIATRERKFTFELLRPEDTIVALDVLANALGDRIKLPADDGTGTIMQSLSASTLPIQAETRTPIYICSKCNHLIEPNPIKNSEEKAPLSSPCMKGHRIAVAQSFRAAFLRSFVIPIVSFVLVFWSVYEKDTNILALTFVANLGYLFLGISALLRAISWKRRKGAVLSLVPGVLGFATAMLLPSILFLVLMFIGLSQV